MAMYFHEFSQLHEVEKKASTGNGKEINYCGEFHARGVCDEIDGKAMTMYFHEFS